MIARRRVGKLTTVAVVAALGASPLGSQIPEIEESVDVRVVNVDVVVSSADGLPIHGLTAADFELRVDGEPVPIDYYYAVAEGRPAAVGVEPRGGATASTDAPTPAPEKPFLAVVFDGRDLMPPQVASAVEGLRRTLDTLLPETRGTMLAHHGRGVRIEQTFTTDRERIEAALTRLEKARAPTLTRGSRRLLLRRIETADRPLPTSVEQVVTSFDRAEDQAQSLLNEIRSQQQVERFEAVAGIQQLESLVRSLAGLPGRKAVLYVGQGLRTQPAEVLYRLWWDKYGGFAPRLGLRSVESELTTTDLTSDLIELVRMANAHRIAFYTHDPSGLRVAGGSMLFDSPQANSLLGDERVAQTASLMTLAEGTGGIGAINGATLEGVVDRMLSGFRTFYSLGFTPLPEQEGRVEVRIRVPGARLRYLDRFRSSTPAQRLNETAMASLLTDVADNPLEASVELGKAERQKNGHWLVPMMVKVPISQLTLLPREASHVGQLSVVVLARGPGGELSAPSGGEVPIEIANSELLAALGSVAGCRLQVLLRAGEQKLTIALRDDVARTESTINLMVDPARGS